MANGKDPLASVQEVELPPEDTVENEDEEYVIEGTPEAEEVSKKTVPETKDDLKEQLRELQMKLEMLKGEPRLPSMVPVLERQVPIEPQKSEDELLSEINNKFLENPGKTAKELLKTELRPIVDLMIQNQTYLSKELALTNPELRKVYDKWKDEVEDYVQKMHPVEKAQNPRVYQTAIERIKAQHAEEILEEEIERRVQERLAKLTEERKVAKPAVYSPAGEQRTGSGERKTVVIPRWVAQEAERIGLDPKFYYEHLKESGKLR